MSKPIDVFIHIPKSAGTTFHSILERNYAYQQQFSFRVPRQLALMRLLAMPESRRNRLDCIKGHCGCGIHEYLSRPVNYFTFLRDPVKRVISEYNYVKKHPKPAAHQVIKENNLSLKQFVEGDLTPDNLQLRYLTFMRLEDAPPGRAQKEWLEPAKKRLAEDFANFGIVEYFDKSLLLFQHRLSLKKIYYASKNQSKPTVKSLTPEPHGWCEDSECVLLIQDRDALHIELYLFARAIFEERWRDFHKNHPMALKDFQEFNRKRQSLTALTDRFQYVASRLTWKLQGNW
jgi:hypothetical protein